MSSQVIFLVSMYHIITFVFIAVNTNVMSMCITFVI
jgi:hypothetical protein